MNINRAFFALVLTGMLTPLIPTNLAFPIRAGQRNSNCENITFTIADTAVSPTSSLGMVTGDLKGALSVTFTNQSPGENGRVNIGVEDVFTDDTGNTLRLKSQGVLTPVEPGVFYAKGQTTVTSGTGKYLNATGALEFQGLVDATRGQNIILVRGQLCRN